ncbi:MAG: hypothetical protein RML93_02355 [Anaerolineales bacterium]|nr:hypothetical protein [Anaerolineales bacterium]MCS7246832.1 hypothetical protein [Anaerolineales bacterium]MDW8160642.1 hypothetical protein [Anaerolineales bacterium]MDW8446117.1 hypothetical protein [Anaerolineales bacterium]
MSDEIDQIVRKVAGDLDPFKKILSNVPGFKGYIDRQIRRDQDKILRDTIASRFEELWQRISALQREVISQGELHLIDDLESAAIKLRSFIDRIRRAPRGYSGLFDAVKIDTDELERLYQYDAALFALAEDVSRAIDNAEASLGSDGFSAALRHLRTTAQHCIDLYERRAKAIFQE